MASYGLWRARASLTGPVNLGNPVEFTMVELAELVIAGNRILIVSCPTAIAAGRPETAQAEYLPCKKASWLDTEGDPQEGLKPTTAYFRSLLIGYARQ